MMKYISLLLLLVYLLALPALSLAQTESEQAAIDFVAGQEDFAAWLENYDGWKGFAYEQGEGSAVWYVEFYDAAEEEWLGYANIDLNLPGVLDSFIPAPLEEEEYARQQEEALAIAANDPEVQALLGNPILWDLDSDYNRYEQFWDLYYSQGLQRWLVRVTVGDYPSLEIIDDTALEEEEAQEELRNRAISTAYMADGVDEALEGYDEWTTYAENQGGSLWTVSFLAGDQTLFYAVVDLSQNPIVETSQ